MLKRLLFCAAVAISYSKLAIASADSLAVNSKPAPIAQSSPEIKVGVHDARPLAWKTAKGDIRGITPYLATQLIHAWRPDSTLQFKLESAERMIQEVSRGQTDLIYAISDPRLETDAIKIKRIATVPLTLWSLAEDPIHEFNDLNNASIATLPAYRNMPYLRNVNIVQLPATKNFLRLLLARRVKGVITFPAMFELMIANEGIARDRLLRIDIAEVDIFLWLSKKSPLSKYTEELKAIAEYANSPEVLNAYLKKVNISRTLACDTNASAQPARDSRVTQCH